jgi:hypothetical protein
MKHYATLSLTGALLLSGTLALANNVRTDYDHGANFSSYHTYSWGTVKTSNPLNEDRVKAAVDKDLQAKGWQLVVSGGSATVFATGNVKNEQEAETMYDGMGGGWGGGWGWGGWGALAAASAWGASARRIPPWKISESETLLSIFSMRQAITCCSAESQMTISQIGPAKTPRTWIRTSAICSRSSRQNRNHD